MTHVDTLVPGNGSCFWAAMTLMDVSCRIVGHARGS